MFRSIRATLLIWQVLLLTTVVGGFGATLFWRVRHATLEQIDADLLGAAQVLATQLAASDLNDASGLGDASGSATTLRIPESYLRRFGPGPRETPYFVVWNAEGQRIHASETAPPRPPELPKPRPGKKPNPFHTRDRDEFREVVLSAASGQQILVGRSIRRELDQLQRLLGWVAASGVGVLLVGLIGAWLLARWIVRPIALVTETAERISATNLSGRIEVPRTKTELGRLAVVLNEMFTRLQAAFERQTRFTADASHELRTPVSVVLFQAELALSKERTPDEYRESLAACQRSAQRMKSLVEDLLTLARADAGQLRLNVAPVALQPLVAEAIALLEPTAQQRGITIAADLQAATVNGDAERLSQVVCNLLSNAIQYNCDQGRIDVTLATHDGEAILRVTDTGIGIAESDLPKLFDRFFRCDAARTDDGGTGLGLAICQEIIHAHGGRIEVTSQPQVGSTFTLRVPKHPPSL
jgi:heavy metal sensor kinase